MLYDNALLLELMTEAWRETKSPLYAAAHRARRSIGCCARWSPEGGGFAASLDADSEGEEGKFYVWSLAEIEEALGARATRSLFAEIYDVTPEGNFEGHTILNRLESTQSCATQAPEARFATMREKLLARRAVPRPPRLRRQGARRLERADDRRRSPTPRDAFDRPDWLAAAERAFDFVSTRMTADGRLLHSYRAGEAKAPATATDYANMIKAALALANVTGNVDYLNRARAWTRAARPALLGGRTSAATISPPTTPAISSCAPINALDDATPERQRHHGVESDGALSVDRRGALPRSRRGDRARLRGAARAQRVRAYRAAHRRARSAWPPAQIVIVVPEGGDARELRRALGERVAAERRGAGGQGRGSSLPANSPAHGKTAIGGKPTAYVCIGPQCSMPVTGARGAGWRR